VPGAGYWVPGTRCEVKETPVPSTQYPVPLLKRLHDSLGLLIEIEIHHRNISRQRNHRT